MARRKRELTDEQKAQLAKQGFQKGKSGNPKGRPPLPEELKQRMAEMAPDALDTVKWLMANSPNDMVRLKCAELLFAPFVSKAAQKIDVKHDHKHTIDDLLARANAAREALAGPVIEAQAIEVEKPKAH